MNISLMFSAILVQILLRSLEASNTRIQQLPLEFGFDQNNFNKSNVFNHNKTVVCMLDSWSHWRNENGKFSHSDIDPSLCSQLVYRTAAIDNETFQIKIKDSYLAENLGWYREVVALSKRFPNLKVILSVGGWTEGSATFSKIAADYKKRTTFVESVLRILQQYEFHGLDVAWEYPTLTSQGGTSQDKDNLPLLLKDLRQALDSEYIISLTVAGDTILAAPAYNIKALVNMVDQFNVKTFDFAGAWNNKAYHHSPLRDEGSKQSVMNTINFYLNGGAPAEKLVVGIPFYGRTFLLKDDVITSASQINGNDTVYKLSGLGEQANGKFSGDWINDDLLMGFHEICYEVSTLNKNNWQTYWDNLCTVPFARHGKRWVTFDNPESVEAKVSFVMANKLKGIMAWTIDTDDFKGTSCKKSAYDNDDDGAKITFPLLRAINFQLLSEEQRSRSDSPGLIPHVFKSDINHDSGLSGENGDSKIQKGKNSTGRAELLCPLLFYIIILMTSTYCIL